MCRMIMLDKLKLCLDLLDVVCCIHSDITCASFLWKPVDHRGDLTQAGLVHAQAFSECHCMQ